MMMIQHQNKKRARDIKCGHARPEKCTVPCGKLRCRRIERVKVHTAFLVVGSGATSSRINVNNFRRSAGAVSKSWYCLSLQCKGIERATHRDGNARLKFSTVRGNEIKSRRLTQRTPKRLPKGFCRKSRAIQFKSTRTVLYFLAKLHNIS